MWNYIEVANHPEMLKNKYKTALNMVFEGGQFTKQIKAIAENNYKYNHALTLVDYESFGKAIYDRVIKCESGLVGRAYWVRHLDSISKSDTTRALYMTQVFYLAGVAILRRKAAAKTFTMQIAKFN